jgi:hypothetical protein
VLIFRNYGKSHILWFARNLKNADKLRIPVICNGSNLNFDGFKIQLLAIVPPFEWIDSLRI